MLRLGLDGQGLPGTPAELVFQFEGGRVDRRIDHIQRIVISVIGAALGSQLQPWSERIDNHPQLWIVRAVGIGMSLSIDRSNGEPIFPVMGRAEIETFLSRRDLAVEMPIVSFVFRHEQADFWLAAKRWGRDSLPEREWRTFPAA